MDESTTRLLTTPPISGPSRISSAGRAARSAKPRPSMARPGRSRDVASQARARLAAGLVEGAAPLDRARRGRASLGPKPGWAYRAGWLRPIASTGCWRPGARRTSQPSCNRKPIVGPLIPITPRRRRWSAPGSCGSMERVGRRGTSRGAGPGGARATRVGRSRRSRPPAHARGRQGEHARAYPLPAGLSCTCHAARPACIRFPTWKLVPASRRAGPVPQIGCAGTPATARSRPRAGPTVGSPRQGR